VPLFAALHQQGPDIKVAAVVSSWQRVVDLIGSGFEPQSYRIRNRRLTILMSFCLIDKPINLIQLLIYPNL